MISDTDAFRNEISEGIPTTLPDRREMDGTVDHAPPRPLSIDSDGFRLAIENALRYFPAEWHEELSKDFAEELDTYGHIYMHRFRPRYPMRARPIGDYPCTTKDACKGGSCVGGAPHGDSLHLRCHASIILAAALAAFLPGLLRAVRFPRRQRMVGLTPPARPSHTDLPCLPPLACGRYSTGSPFDRGPDALP